MAVTNESLFLYQMTANKTGAGVIQLPHHKTNLGCAWATEDLPSSLAD